MAQAVVFDVNETLLDLAGLDPIFARIFGRAGGRQEWFGQVLQSALTATVTDAYADFGEIGQGALTMVAARHGVALRDEDRAAVREGMSRLPPHSDAREGLERLRDAGLRLATLTNNALPVVEAQLANAGLRDLFELVLSADEVRRLKPAPEPYRMAAERLGVPVGQVRLVATHAWDIAGAMRAGCAAAFVARPGQVLDPLAPAPDVVGRDLREVAEGIVKADIG
ncbi:MAG: haloacid dehalogenase type II [Chloroflexota bacterium]|nr:haloacid dehalogenase type II [Chloroflexota bacterium]